MDILPYLVRPEPASWDAGACEEELVAHGIAPLAAARLADGAARGRLSAARYAAAAAHLARRRVLSALATAFRESGVPCLVLKGEALADRCWPDAALRPSCDVDLLVRASDLVTAGGLFRRLGYGLVAKGSSSQKWQPPSPGLPPLDVTAAPRAPGATNPTWVCTTDELFERSEPIVSLPGLRRMGDVDAVVHGAVHAADHAFSRFVWLADLAFMARIRPDLFVPDGEVAAAADRLRARRAVRLALHLTTVLFRPDGLPACPAPWGTAWFVRRVLRRSLGWGDAVIGGRLRILLRAALVDRPGDLARAALGLSVRHRGYSGGDPTTS